MIVTKDMKETLLYQAVSLTEVYMKEITRSDNGLKVDGPKALQSFYDKLVEIWKQD